VVSLCFNKEVEVVAVAMRGLQWQGPLLHHVDNIDICLLSSGTECGTDGTQYIKVNIAS
jgi:hypothetical protein